MADWMGWFFAFDDILDNTDEGRDQEFAAFVADTINSVHNSAPPPRHDPDVEPYRVAMKDLWTRTTTDMPRSWCRRLTTCCRCCCGPRMTTAARP
ncbi:terpene synthase family protein [Streptomyces pathocidini]|uniref:terpene synthase family protein n=1 Tax=Streptomyces pathocidini TaxID=1650571 RepID=UPI0033F117A1